MEINILGIYNRHTDIKWHYIVFHKVHSTHSIQKWIISQYGFYEFEIAEYEKSN